MPRIAARLVAGLHRVMHDLAPRCMDAADAAELMLRFAEGERLCAAGKTLLLPTVDDSGIWKREGYRSCAHFLAAKTGIPVGHAVQMVETARRLESQPAVEERVRDGRLSQPQAQQVTAAVEVAPHATQDLLECAEENDYIELQRTATQVTTNVLTEEDREARYQRIHASRYVRGWKDPDGARRGEWRLTPDADQRLWAWIRAEQDRIFRQARAEGRHESPDAYAADALVALADRAPTGTGDGNPPASPTTTVLLRVDANGLQRHPVANDDEGICEIAGVGPVPVSVAREALGNDAIVKLVITKGVDVLNVTHIGRTRTAAVQTALDWLYDECGVKGCHQRVHLEYHHVEAYRKTHHTRLAELVPLCKQHHHVVEHRGFDIRRRDDNEYDLLPPDRGRPGGMERGPPTPE